MGEFSVHICQGDIMGSKTVGGAKVRTRVATEAYVFMAVDVFLLIVLVLGAYLWHARWGPANPLHDPLGGLIPLVVPWGGALGGVCASLFGVAMHGRDWDVTYNTWHWVRVPLGALTGTIAFLVVVIVLKVMESGGSTTAGPGGAAPTGTLDMGSGALALYLVIAFVAGFQNRYFLDLVKKIAKVLFSNGEEKSDELSVTVTPDEISFGEVTDGERTAVVSVDVTGAKDLTLSPGWYNHIQPPFCAKAETNAEVLGQTHREIQVTYRALPAAAEHVDHLLVTVGGITRDVRLSASTPAAG